MIPQAEITNETGGWINPTFCYAAWHQRALVKFLVFCTRGIIFHKENNIFLAKFKNTTFGGEFKVSFSAQNFKYFIFAQKNSNKIIF